MDMLWNLLIASLHILGNILLFYGLIMIVFEKELKQL